MKLQQKQVSHRIGTIAFGSSHLFCWKPDFVWYPLQKLIEHKVLVPPVLNHYFLATHGALMLPSSVLHWKCYVRITCNLNNIITNITYLLHYKKPQKEGLANKISSAHASLACEFCELLFLLLSRNVIHQA